MVFQVVRLPNESQLPKGYWHKVIGGRNLAALQASFMSVLADVEIVFPVTFFLEVEEAGDISSVMGQITQMEWLDARRVNLTLQHGTDTYQIRDYNHVACKGDMAVMEIEGFVPRAKRYPPRFEVDPDIKRALSRLLKMAGVALATGRMQNLSDLHADARQVINETKPLADILNITT